MMRLVSTVLPIILVSLPLPSAVAESGRKSSLTMNQWVHLSAEGGLRGRVVISARDGKATAVDGAELRLRSSDGTIVRGNSDADGGFQFADIAPGIYTFVASTAETFATAALHVMPFDQQQSSGLPSVVNLSAAEIPPATVAMAVQRYLPPQINQQSPSMETARLDQLADQIVGSDLHLVAQTNGGFTGQIFVAGATGSELNTPSRTNVFVFHQGSEVARSLTDDQGRFQLTGLPLGQYSLLAVGRDGIGSIGFVLVNQELQEARLRSQSGGAQTLVAEPGCCLVQPEFAMQIAPLAGACEIVQELPVAAIPCDPCGAPIPACGCGEVVEGTVVEEPPLTEPGTAGSFGGGGYGGFGGGGGGGGFGGGGFGGIGALGGLGAVIAAVAGGGDSSAPILQPVIVSPNQPPAP